MRVRTEPEKTALTPSKEHTDGSRRGARGWVNLAWWLFITWAIGVTPAAAAPDLGLQPVLTAQEPVYVLAAPGDERSLYVVEQGGRIRRYQPGVESPQLVLDIRGQVSGRSEQGLLSMAFHPDFPRQRFIYIDFTATDGSTLIERYRLSADYRAQVRSRVRLLRIPQPFGNHNGGQLQVGPRDGYLYIGMGDGGAGFDPKCSGQDPHSLLGKMLRVDIRKKIAEPPYHAAPTDNPFVGRGGGEALIWSQGLRNPWRFSFDSETGDLYIADVGQHVMEEIDVEKAGTPGGLNYGWRTMEGSRCVEEQPLCASAKPCGDKDYVAPVFEYGHSEGCSITGGYVYRGELLPELQGDYVYGDYCSGHIWALRRDAGGQYRSRLLIEKAGERLKSFGLDGDGELLVVLDRQVLRLVPRGTAPEVGAKAPVVGATAQQGQGDQAAGKETDARRPHDDDDEAPAEPSFLSKVLQGSIAVLFLLGMVVVLWFSRRS